MTSRHFLALLSLLLLGGCLVTANDDDSAADDDDATANDDDATGDDDDATGDDDDATGDDDDATGDDDDATGDDDDATGDDDDATGDDDDATAPPPLDVGTLPTAALVGFGETVGAVALELSADDLGGATSFISGDLTDSSGASVGSVSAGTDGLVSLSWSGAAQDWRAENPVVLDLVLSVGTDDGPMDVTGAWEIEALPGEVAISWGDSGGWAMVPAALAPRANDAFAFGSAQFSPASEPATGLWSLGTGVKPSYTQLSGLCTTAGTSGAEACFAGFATTFSGAVQVEVEATTADGQAAQVHLIEPFDWDDDGDVDGDDLMTWSSGTAPCREIVMSNLSVPYMIGPSEHTMTGPVSVEGDGRARTGAFVDTVAADAYVYNDSTGNYAAGAQISGASVVNQGAGLFTLELPPDAFDFRVTNPATVYVELTAQDADGRCFTGNHLITVGATPESTAIAWIGGTGYLGTGAIVAPRPGNSVYYDNYSTYFGATSEVETGIWELSATSQPNFTNMDLLYFSAGARYATSYNESLIHSFSQISSSPLILEGSVLSNVTSEVHYPVLTDLNGDSVITTADLRAYLDAL